MTANAEQIALWNGPGGERRARQPRLVDTQVRLHHERLLAAAAVRPAEQVLDVGCGTGQTTRDAARAAAVRGEGEAGGVPYVATPYVDRMDLAYAAADFALCRAGAMTCAELTAVGLPAAYVPLPIGNGEQRLNAVPIVQRGGGMLVNNADLTPEWIRDTLLPVLVNIDQVADMSEAAHSLGRGDADRWLAEAVIEILEPQGTGGIPG